MAEGKAAKKSSAGAARKKASTLRQRVRQQDLRQAAVAGEEVQKFEFFGSPIAPFQDQAQQAEAQAAAAPEQNEQQVAPTPEPEPWQRSLLVARGGTRYYAAIDDRAWRRPVDALVLPGGTRSFGGMFAIALFHDVGPESAELLRASLEASLRERPVRPDFANPVLCPLPDPLATVLAPRFLICATAYGPGPSSATESQAAAAAVNVVRLADEMGLRRIAMPLLGTGHGELPPETVGPAILRAMVATAPRNSKVEEITLVTISPSAFAALEGVFRQRSQGFANDLASGDDLLDMEAESFALAETLLLRDVNPPLVTGIFGGWGSGKSFAMHLMQRRIAEIRSLPVRAELAWPEAPPEEQAIVLPDGQPVPVEQPSTKAAFPWVGHPYIVHFDAWTYAKSNLWASLMQKIFYDLNVQVSLESELGRIGIDPLAGGSVWRVLSAMNEAARTAILENELGREVLKDVHASELTTEDRLWRALRKQKRKEHETLKKLEITLAEKVALLEQANKEIEHAVDAEIEDEARWDAWESVKSTLSDKAMPLVASLGKRIAPPAPAGGKSAAEIAKAPGFFKTTLRWLVIGAAIALLLALLPRLFEKIDQWIAYAASSTTLAGALFAAYLRWKHLIDEGYAAYEKHLAGARSARLGSRDARVRSALEKQRCAALTDQDDDHNVGALEHRIAELEARIGYQRQRAGVTAEFLSLTEFVRARLKQEAYDKDLGIMHRIQQDLAELTNSLLVHEHDIYADEKKHLFPRGPARVLLFIDDLDRCPPARVVEVLEAAQLLVKTPLFIVIVAMDDRYVTRALEKAYSGVLMRQGDPSGLDYIEKIIQIPYRVRNLAGSAVSSYLSAQMHIKPSHFGRPADAGAGEAAPDVAPAATGASNARDNEPDPHPLPDRMATEDEAAVLKTPPRRPRRDSPSPGLDAPPALEVLPTEVLVFSEAEFDNLRRCCEIVDLTPRAVKRLVNVYKLLKILWYRPNCHPHPDATEEWVLVVLLALSGRHPDLMRPVLEDIATKAGTSPQAFIEYFEAMQQSFPDRVIEREWQQALRAVRALIPPSFTLEALRPDTYRLIRSFCFVGDIGYEPGERISLFAPSPPDPPGSPGLPGPAAEPQATKADGLETPSRG